ncbi:hypothetical protein J3R04_003875 [Spirilliplanes yamanashiensis]|nr:hypothetical protein [Spirilliplanes yamanashiensis]
MRVMLKALVCVMVVLAVAGLAGVWVRRGRGL